MAEIIELRPPETGLDDQIFNAACEMEGDLRAIDGFADALALVSETMDESPHANAINGLAWEIKHRAQRMEARRDNLFTRVLPNSGALLQLVAIDDRASSARHVGDGFFQIHAQTVGDRGTYRCGRTIPRVKWPCLSCSAVPLPRLIALPTKRPRLSVKVVALLCLRAVPANYERGLDQDPSRSRRETLQAAKKHRVLAVTSPQTNLP